MTARSNAQTATSRKNGAKSNGPATENGKANSAKNAQKHGLCGAELVFADTEAQAAFDHQFESLIKRHLPVDDEELACCREMAVAHWRRQVAIQMEVALIQAVDNREACAENGGQGLPSLKTILRYQSRIDRDLARAEQRLRDLRQQREPQPPPANNNSHPSTSSDQDYLTMDEALIDAGIKEPERPAHWDLMNRSQKRQWEAKQRRKMK